MPLNRPALFSHHRHEETESALPDTQRRNLTGGLLDAPVSHRSQRRAHPSVRTTPELSAPSSFASVVTDVIVLEHPSLHRRA
jgi:hypothetical protein